MFIFALFLWIVLILVAIVIMALLPSYRDKPKIFLFKKVDLLVQHILIALNFMAAISVIFSMLLMVLLPLLGLTQLTSVAIHAYHKELSVYHKNYIKILPIVAVVIIINVVFFRHKIEFLWIFIILGFGMGIYYWIISMKTKKTIYATSEDTLENQ